MIHSIGDRVSLTRSTTPWPSPLKETPASLVTEYGTVIELNVTDSPAPSCTTRVRWDNGRVSCSNPDYLRPVSARRSRGAIIKKHAEA
jgi:hypothetical protein